MDILDLVEATSIFDSDHTLKQYEFARRKVLRAMSGIAKVKSFPVTILAKDALMALVNGVEDSEMAEFVMRMGRCHEFQLLAMPSDKKFNLGTSFVDMDEKVSHIFGIRKTVRGPIQRKLTVTDVVAEIAEDANSSTA